MKYFLKKINEIKMISNAVISDIIIIYLGQGQFLFYKTVYNTLEMF